MDVRSDDNLNRIDDDAGKLAELAAIGDSSGSSPASPADRGESGGDQSTPNDNPSTARQDGKPAKSTEPASPASPGNDRDTSRARTGGSGRGSGNKRGSYRKRGSNPDRSSPSSGDTSSKSGKQAGPTDPTLGFSDLRKAPDAVDFSQLSGEPKATKEKIPAVDFVGEITTFLFAMLALKFGPHWEVKSDEAKRIANAWKAYAKTLKSNKWLEAIAEHAPLAALLAAIGTVAGPRFITTINQQAQVKNNVRPTVPPVQNSRQRANAPNNTAPIQNSTQSGDEGHAGGNGAVDWDSVFIGTQQFNGRNGAFSG